MSKDLEGGFLSTVPETTDSDPAYLIQFDNEVWGWGCETYEQIHVLTMLSLLCFPSRRTAFGENNL